MTLTFRLTAVKPDAVALTHGTVGSVGDAHAVLVTSRSATVTRDWNVVVDFLPVFFSTMLYAPVADVRAVNFDAAPFSNSRTCEPATPAPACVSRPETRSVRFFLFVTRVVIDSVPEPTIERVSTVPATFGVPVPAA